MSTDKYVKNTLTMPSDIPFFTHNINFEGLRNLLETVNISTNTNTQNIQTLTEEVSKKLPALDFQNLQKMLDVSLKFGLHTEKMVEESENATEKIQRKELHMMNHFEKHCWKVGRLMNVVEQILVQTQQNTQKLNTNDRKHEKHIDESFRRIEERTESSLESMTKNINMYFTNTNEKIGQLQTNINGLKFDTENSIDDIKKELDKRVSDNYLKNALNGIDKQVKASLEEELKNDHMKRLASLNEFSTKLKEHMKDTDSKYKGMKNSLKQMTEKVGKCLTTHSFQIEKHKIYDKLSQFRSRIEESLKRGQEFLDFRKNSLETQERVRQNILGIEDQLKKMKEKGSSMKKMQNIGDILEKLDPHLICQVSSEVKLHEKQIGKLEKQIIFLQKELQASRGEKMKMPEFNSGQTSQIVVKLIKEYMTNMDFDGRVKRAEKQIHEISRRSDGVNDLQKKIYMISKEMDIGMIMKEIKKKCDEQTTKRDIRIVDSKIQKLFEFYKQTRKQIEDLSKRSFRTLKEPESASIATKRLYPTNCISCTPKHRNRTYSKNKMEGMDESLDFIKQSMYAKNL